jgi:hypothetical protein
MARPYLMSSLAAAAFTAVTLFALEASAAPGALTNASATAAGQITPVANGCGRGWRYAPRLGRCVRM